MLCTYIEKKDIKLLLGTDCIKVKKSDCGYELTVINNGGIERMLCKKLIDARCSYERKYLNVLCRDEAIKAVAQMHEKFKLSITGAFESEEYIAEFEFFYPQNLNFSKAEALLTPIVFDQNERKKAFYAEPNDVLANYTNDCRFCFYQHFTHAVMALVKLTARHGGRDLLKARLTELFSGNSGKDIVFYVSDGKPLGAFGEEMRDFMDNVLKMLSE